MPTRKPYTPWGFEAKNISARGGSAFGGKFPQSKIFWIFLFWIFSNPSVVFISSCFSAPKYSVVGHFGSFKINSITRFVRITFFLQFLYELYVFFYKITCKVEFFRYFNVKRSKIAFKFFRIKFCQPAHIF